MLRNLAFSSLFLPSFSAVSLTVKLSSSLLATNTAPVFAYIFEALCILCYCVSYSVYRVSRVVHS